MTELTIGQKAVLEMVGEVDARGGMNVSYSYGNTRECGNRTTYAMLEDEKFLLDNKLVSITVRLTEKGKKLYDAVKYKPAGERP